MFRIGLFESVRAILIVSVVLFTSACARSAANMAATQPEAKDLTVLTKGTHRDKVVARLGAPESSTPYDDMVVDVYKFVQGYSAGARTARVFTHSTLSIATLGLWEVAGTAIEGYARGNTVSVRVVYDSRGQLESYEILDGQDAIDDEIVEHARPTPQPAPTASNPSSQAPSDLSTTTSPSSTNLPDTQKQLSHSQY